MSAHAIFYKKIRSKSFFYFAFCISCVGLVTANIIFSQRYNVNMYGVMRGEKTAILNYLKHIWGTPLFNLELSTYKMDGREEVLTDWTFFQQISTKRIQSLEEVARLHPYSPELYYNLYLLYSERGQNIKAQEYLQKARQIDPSI